MSRLPEYDGSLSRKLRQRDRQMVRQADASAFNRSGTSVTAEGETTVTGTLNIDGDLNVSGPLAVTGPADITGTTHIGGSTDIDGTLNVDADTTIGGTLGVTGPTTLGGVTEIDGATSINDTLDVYGQLDVHDGAGFRALYPDGATGAKFGPLMTEPGGVPDGMGLLIQGPTSDGSHDIFRARYDASGVKRVQIGESGQPVAQVWGLSEKHYLEATGAGTGTDAGMWLHSAGDIRLTSANFTLTIPWSTSSSAANMFLDTNGRIWKSTSARKYKQDIENAEIDVGAVLRMQPRTWRDRAEVEREPESDRRYVGFIAEELDDLGLGEFVTRDEAGEADGIAYDRLVAAVIPVLRSLSERLDRLEPPTAP